MNFSGSQPNEEIDIILSEELDGLRAAAMLVGNKVKKRELTLQGFHAVIGGKNNIYANCINTQFKDPEDFIAHWTVGLTRIVKEKDAANLKFDGKFLRDSAAHDVARILRNPAGRAYIHTFLRRNFYRQYDARVRYKPDENLWAIWFGSPNALFGLLISPDLRNGEWVNDKSQMRREPYVYWTVGHVLMTGLVTPDEPEPMKFADVASLITFYRFLVKKVSNSQYEKGIVDWYIRYLQSSSDVLGEPLLIPEFRYAGLDKKHEFRLDYTIFNVHTQEQTGFELSPHSTHGALKQIKDKTQKAVNRELAIKWEHEMDKRNKYFKKYKIPVITFADSALANLDECFAEIAARLRARQPREITFCDAMEQFDALAL